MIAVEYNMPSHTTVRRWIIKYTEGKENKNYSPKPEVYNMKSRKTTLEERIEIVNYCLNNELSYKDTAERFNVSYSQVYNWIRKYREYGEPGLYDGRGKGKPAEILSTEEELKLKVKALETRNKFLEMENETLKRKTNRKAADESKVRQVASYKTVDELKNRYPIKWLCKILNIARSSYYKWLNRTIPSLERENEELVELIQQIHDSSGGIYGYRRIHIFLRLFTDWQVNHKRVQRITNKYNIKSSIRQKRRNIFPAHQKLQH